MLLAGNALAVHDAELALFGTSLGVDLEAGDAGPRRPPPPHARDQRDQPRRRHPGGGRRPACCRAASWSSASGPASSYVLAGSIRDDGPIVDTVTDIVEAQDRYAEALAGVGPGHRALDDAARHRRGNMLPAWVPVVCVDINPAVVTKLADRGSSQTIGLVTDVGLFLHQLAISVGEPARRGQHGGAE